jgi:hypothetical protein
MRNISLRITSYSDKETAARTLAFFVADDGAPRVASNGSQWYSLCNQMVCRVLYCAAQKARRMSTNSMKSRQFQAIRDYLAKNPGAKRGELAEHVSELTARDPSTLWRYLEKLKEQGSIRSEGILKGTRYFLNVPLEAEPFILKAVVDIVRYGHTFALEQLIDGQEHARTSVQRTLDDLAHNPKLLQRFGLTDEEFARHKARLAPPDDMADVADDVAEAIAESGEVEANFERPSFG